MKRPTHKKNLEKIKKQKWKSHPNLKQFKKTTRKSFIQSKRKRKKSVYSSHHKLSYRGPILMMLGVLILCTLAIPSLIVIPFSEQTEQSTVSEEEIPSLETESEEEAISVAVMRTKADIVEDVPLENYIVGVVAAEMPVEFEHEALKAQALAARTYAVTHLLGGQEEKESYDLTDTIQHQVYKNDKELKSQWGSAYEENIAKIRSAVQETMGEIITYEDAPIMPAYFSMSNGFTENSEDYWENELPYLRSVESEWELDNPKLLNQETFTKDELETLLSVDISDETEDQLGIQRKDSGRVETLTVDEETFTGREIREKLSLRSSDFSIKQKNDHFVFTTKGNGHGIGMSQYGADAMAKEGKTYKDIINHYYHNIEINSIDETTPALASK